MTDAGIQVIRDAIDEGKDDGNIASLHIERLQELLSSYLRMKNMTRWAHFLHAFGRHRWTRYRNPVAKRVRGGWVIKLVCDDCGAEEVISTWLK